VESALTPTSLTQLLCTAVVVLDQMVVQALHPQGEEVTAIRQQQTEVVVVHSPHLIAGLHLQVLLEL
jgi:hypothetical protein